VLKWIIIHGIFILLYRDLDFSFIFLLLLFLLPKQNSSFRLAKERKVRCEKLEAERLEKLKVANPFVRLSINSCDFRASALVYFDHLFGCYDTVLSKIFFLGLYLIALRMFTCTYRRRPWVS